MKFFTLFDKKDLSPGNKKVIPQEEFSILLEAKELVDTATKEAHFHKEEVEAAAKKKGFEEGLSTFTEQIALLEKERKNLRAEMEKKLTPLAIAAVKKIIGRELELKRETIVDLVATALKGISHSRKVKIFLNKNDFEMVEKEKPRLKQIFDHLETLSVSYREDIPENGCTIETEAGILHVGLQNQLEALEKAFQILFEKEKSS